MISTTNVSLAYGKKALFKEVNIKFTKGNCYGLIGANGAGKSTFLKILSGDIDPDSGSVSVGAKERIAVLRQDHFAFDDEKVLDTVLMGHKTLYALMAEREALYAKPDFSEADGLRSSELEAEFEEMNGYEAESEAGSLLNHLMIPDALHQKMMKELEGGEKVRVLLAQALFGNPDVLLLDEPTNNLDIRSVAWLTSFLERFENTVIVVSHDRHFMNEVCTHIADIDFRKISVYAGNYDFWYQASQLHLKQKQAENKKVTERANELKSFIQRFSSNASKSKQATSRKKLLEKLTLEDMPVSSRKYPFIRFQPEKPCGNVILEVEGLSKTIDGVKVLNNVSFTVNSNDKIAFMGENALGKTTLFRILAGEIKPDSGTFRWGMTITTSYFPKEHSTYFNKDQSIIDWLLEFAPEGEGERFARTFLGRMLFSGEDATKKINVLSGGEKVRCMLSKLMLSEANLMILDEPTNHLDLESITALNNALIRFPGVILFTSHDHELLNTVSTRVIELTNEGICDQLMTFEAYIEHKKMAGEKRKGLSKAA